MSNALRFDVDKHDLGKTAITEVPLPSRETLPDNGLLVKVDRFAFTANNITYAMLGDAMKYWQLFPATDGFGNIPVWGFGDVVASKHPQVAEGERLFGYFPMATHLAIEATDVSKRGLRDGAAHRQGVAAVYNAYARVSDDPAFAGRDGDWQALLRPLFMLSFLVDDFLAEAEFFGAKQVILSSASSKTAFGLAHLLHSQRQAVRVIGMTSPGNADFVASLGCYHDVIPYDWVDSLAPEQPTAFVDMAGNADLRGRLHRRFGDRLVYSGRVGLTHQDTGEVDDLPGAKPSWFFAPDQIRKRAKEWGPGGIDQRFGAAWAGLVPLLDKSLTIIEGCGVDVVERVYRETLLGQVAPNEGHMLSLFAR